MHGRRNGLSRTDRARRVDFFAALTKVNTVEPAPEQARRRTALGARNEREDTAERPADGSSLRLGDSVETLGNATSPKPLAAGRRWPSTRVPAPNRSPSTTTAGSSRPGL